jgi:molybdopterin/thiamine biosynthesis adenylyltransferase
VADGTVVKLIGLGGVGGIVARYLAIFLASFDADVRLVLIDGDRFEEKNASRMLFSSYGNKAAVVCDDLLEHVEHSRLTVAAVEEYVTADNLDRLIVDGDIVVLAVDNHATRKLVNDHCASRLADVCLVSGGNDGIDVDPAGRQLRGTYGNVQLYIRRDGRDVTPSLTRYHAEIAAPADRLPTDASCTELVASVPQILFANLMTAAAICNGLWLHLCSKLHYSEVCFDIFDGLMRPLDLPWPSATECQGGDDAPKAAIPQ